MTFKVELIKKIEENGGAIPLDQFMGICNHHYYSHKDPLGTDGDFTTAPEISQMFGEIIAAWLVDILGQFGSDKNITLLECGPGRGTLLFDILRILKYFNVLSRVEKIILLEASESLKAVQKQTLKDYTVEWIDDIHNSILKDIAGPIFVIGNEFLDALPIKQYKFQNSAWYERCVEFKNSKFQIISHETDFVPSLSSPINEDIFETSPAVETFLSDVSKLISEKGGGTLFIDYGYNKTVYGDTFQALKKHQYADPLDNVGEVDLTAHINFEVVGNIFKSHDLQVHGPTTQKRFLEGCGLHQRAESLKSKLSDDKKKDIDRDVARLVSPFEMGTLFKVIAATSKNIKPVGF